MDPYRQLGDPSGHHPLDLVPYLDCRRLTLGWGRAIGALVKRFANQPVVAKRIDYATLPPPIWLVAHGEQLPTARSDRPSSDCVWVLDYEVDAYARSAERVSAQVKAPGVLIDHIEPCPINRAFCDDLTAWRLDSRPLLSIERALVIVDGSDRASNCQEGEQACRHAADSRLADCDDSARWPGHRGR